MQAVVGRHAISARWTFLGMGRKTFIVFVSHHVLLRGPVQRGKGLAEDLNLC